MEGSGEELCPSPEKKIDFGTQQAIFGGKLGAFVQKHSVPGNAVPTIKINLGMFPGVLVGNDPCNNVIVAQSALILP